jgi:signal recognition particle subunit SRP54
MFESLTEKLTRALKKLRDHGRLDDEVIDGALREVRLSLLEADVHFKVVKDFTDRVAERARGAEVAGSLTPAQQVVKIVRDELVAIMGERAEPLIRATEPPTAVMLVGLQGSGKTTTVGKLARMLIGQGRKVILVACDIHRPAAADQLETIAGQVGAEIVRPAAGEGLDTLAVRAISRGAESRADVIIYDTAGRLHVDAGMMDEAVNLARLVRPHETLLVADAMTGQDAVNVARGFAGALALTGIVLTKFDGDARGGAALSMRQVVGVPIKFVGLGEKLDALEVFHPERVASRILGMGDVLTLIEKAEAAFDREQARDFGDKIRKNRFTLEDFRENLRSMKKMGTMEEVMGMIPGLNKLAAQGEAVDEKQLVRVEAIIGSMTAGERRNHKIINPSRRRRIARGSGTDVIEVNRLLKQFEQMQKMMKRINRMGGLGRVLKAGRRPRPA